MHITYFILFVVLILKAVSGILWICHYDAGYGVVFHDDTKVYVTISFCKAVVFMAAVPMCWHEYSKQVLSTCRFCVRGTPRFQYREAPSGCKIEGQRSIGESQVSEVSLCSTIT